MAATRLERASVDSLLQEHRGDDVRCIELERGPVGNGQETWFVRCTDADVDELVLRLTAAAGPLTWTDRRAEAALLNRLADAGMTVPRVLWVADETSPLGRSHLAMQRLPGEPAIQARGETRRSLLEQLGEHLARLHDRAPEPGTATAAATAEVDRWRRRAAALEVPVPPLLHALLAWVDTGLPDEATPAVMLWGDAGLHNVLAADGQVTGLLDWELAHPGHPAEDLAIAAWMEGGDDDALTALLTGYRRGGGRDIDHDLVERYLVLAAVTRSLMVLAGAEEVQRARLHAPTLAGLALQLPPSRLVPAALRAGFGRHTATSVPGDPHGAIETDDRPATAAAAAPGVDTLGRALAAFLRDDVLPATEDRRLRRELKVAGALLDTLALRAVDDPVIAADRDVADRALLDDLAAAGLPTSDGLAGVAVHVETHEVDDALRARVRQHLIDDLTERTRTLEPLFALLGR